MLLPYLIQLNRLGEAGKMSAGVVGIDHMHEQAVGFLPTNL